MGLGHLTYVCCSSDIKVEKKIAVAEHLLKRMIGRALQFVWLSFDETQDTVR